MDTLLRMMDRCLALAAVIVVMICRAYGAAPEKSVRKPASLAPLPRLTVSMSISPEEVGHPEIGPGTNALATRVTRLRKEIKGVPADAERHSEAASFLKFLHRGAIRRMPGDWSCRIELGALLKTFPQPSLDPLCPSQCDR